MENFLAELARSLANAAAKPNVLGYVPNSPIHQEFHKSTKIGRLLRGGNRSGKSTAGIVESIWRATGRHPYQKTHELPIQGRIVTVDRENGIELIIKPLLAQWTPPSELVNGSWTDSWQNRGSVMTFRNGSSIEVRTHQQDVEAFAGVPRHFVHFDEECPSDIFNECRLRLVDYNGVWYMTMTPVAGQDWIFDRFITSNSKHVDLFEVDIASNPHLNQEALRILNEDLTDDEKEVRQKGVFVPRGGLVLKEFDYSRHVIDNTGEIPKNWAVYVSIDHGFNNPTAILWHAVSVNREVVTFYEHYMRKMLIKDHAKKIKEINYELDVNPLLYMGDPSMSQKTAETGSSPLLLYRLNGIPLMQAKRDVGGRINKMNEYLKYDRWHITNNCVNTIKEARAYSFDIHVSSKIADRSNPKESPRKKNDHAMDSSGYFFTFMPFLGPEDKRKHKSASLTVTNKEDFPWDVDSSFITTDETDYSFGEIG